MPMSGGQYVPMTDYQRGLAQRYMQNRIAAGGAVRANVITDTIRRIGVDRSDAAVLGRDYSTAQRAVDAAAIVRRTHNRTPLPSEMPRVIGDSSRSGQYRYEILVTSTNATTGQTSVQRSYIYSAYPMSLDLVRGNVDANYTYYIRTMQSPAHIPPTTQRVTLNTMVLSVGLVR